METIKLLIVDDRDIFRDSLKLLFTETTGIKVSGEASDGEEAINLIKENEYDVVLMDLLMPNMNGIAATQKIMKLKPTIKILANSFSNSPYHIKDLVEAGAFGFIQKDEDKDAYVKAIKKVHNGEIFLSDEVNHKVYDKVLDSMKN